MCISIFGISSAGEWPQAVHNFPRLLITAHSNSAVQQLQQRTSAGCFVDRDGRCLVTNKKFGNFGEFDFS